MSDYPNERDCEHGRLRRKCELCELNEALAENVRLQAVVDAAREKARQLLLDVEKPESGDYEAGTAMAAAEILRTLGGEVKP